jgi:hypothetical protein
MWKDFRVDRREISFLRFIFEGYDGIALVTTLDRDTGLVRIHMAPGCENDVEGVLSGLAEEILIEPASGSAGRRPLQE